MEMNDISLMKLIVKKNAPFSVEIFAYVINAIGIYAGIFTMAYTVGLGFRMGFSP